jgi:lipopolysaccharide biosynthesis glycosyltransferase
MNNWTFEGKELEEVPADSIGFVYQIECTENGKKYIGQKSFETNRKKQVLCRQKGEVVKDSNGKSKKKNVREKKESNWRNYYGSSKTLQADIEKFGKENFKREILMFAKQKGQLNRMELEMQILSNCVPREDYYNEMLATVHHGNASAWTQEEKDAINKAAKIKGLT